MDKAYIRAGKDFEVDGNGLMAVDLTVEQPSEVIVMLDIDEKIEYWKHNGNGGLCYQLVEYWGCVVAEVEGNLEMDGDTWEDYTGDPRPYLEDVIGDYHQPQVLLEKFHIDLGCRKPNEWKEHYDNFHKVINAALDQYLS